MMMLNEELNKKYTGKNFTVYLNPIEIKKLAIQCKQLRYYKNGRPVISRAIKKLIRDLECPENQMENEIIEIQMIEDGMIQESDSKKTCAIPYRAYKGNTAKCSCIGCRHKANCHRFTGCYIPGCACPGFVPPEMVSQEDPRPEFSAKSQELLAAAPIEKKHSKLIEDKKAKFEYFKTRLAHHNVGGG